MSVLRLTAEKRRDCKHKGVAEMSVAEMSVLGPGQGCSKHKSVVVVKGMSVLGPQQGKRMYYTRRLLRCCGGDRDVKKTGDARCRTL
jgi:hypothetical protein